MCPISSFNIMITSMVVNITLVFGGEKVMLVHPDVGLLFKDAPNHGFVESEIGTSNVIEVCEQTIGLTEFQSVSQAPEAPKFKFWDLIDEYDVYGFLLNDVPLQRKKYQYADIQVALHTTDPQNITSFVPMDLIVCAELKSGVAWGFNSLSTDSQIYVLARRPQVSSHFYFLGLVENSADIDRSQVRRELELAFMNSQIVRRYRKDRVDICKLDRFHRFEMCCAVYNSLFTGDKGAHIYQVQDAVFECKRDIQIAFDALSAVTFGTKSCHNVEVVACAFGEGRRARVFYLNADQRFFGKAFILKKDGEKYQLMAYAENILALKRATMKYYDTDDASSSSTTK